MYTISNSHLAEDTPVCLQAAYVSGTFHLFQEKRVPSEDDLDYLN